MKATFSNFADRAAMNSQRVLGGIETELGVFGRRKFLGACGAVKGAIDDVVLANLTGLLARIKPAIPATKFEGEKSSKNPKYVDAVARTNVMLVLADIRRRSPILEELEKKGSMKIAGAMYDLGTGVVEFGS